MFKNMFKSKHKKQQQNGPSLSDAIQRLRGVEETLLKKQEYLELKIQAELDIIKKNGMKNKWASIAALKRKKRLEAQLQQIDGTLTTLETQRLSLEQVVVEALRSMKFAAGALKVAQQRRGDTDSVAEVIDDIREQQELAQEIRDIISQPFGQGVEDEDDLLRELEELEQEQLDEQLPVVPTAQPLPKQKTKTKPKEDEAVVGLGNGRWVRGSLRGSLRRFFARVGHNSKRNNEFIDNPEFSII